MAAFKSRSLNPEPYRNHTSKMMNMRVSQFVWRATAVAALVFAACVCAAVPAARLPAILGPRAVLQAGKPVNVWGFDARPGTTLSVELSDAGTGAVLAAATVVANAQGRFEAALPAMGHSRRPMTLTISSPGADSVVVHDLLVGEVWVCSGQSNMAWPLNASEGGPDIAAAATNGLIRLLDVHAVPRLFPTNDFQAEWVASTPRAAGAFSAIGYRFGAELHERLPDHPPIGLVNGSLGGMPARAFVSLDALAEGGFTNHTANWTVALAVTNTSPQAWAAYEAQLAAHKASVHFEDRNPPASEAPEFAAPKLDVSDWRPCTVPNALETILDDPRFNGVAWFRKDVAIPAEWNGKALVLELGVIDDFDMTYFNGRRVGGTDRQTPRYWTVRRQYAIPADQVKAGKAVIAVRVMDDFLGGGFNGSTLVLRLADDPGASSIDLAGDWLCKVDYRIEETLAPAKPGEVSPDTPGALYNAFIAPIEKFRIAGVLWYQGERDAGAAEEYRSMFKTLIRDWRAKWRDPAMPFLWCQLANFGARSARPADTGWANLRDAQTAALELPATAQAVLVDVGDPGDIHPRDKRTPASRLCRAALNVAYGRKDVVWSGPTLERITAKNGTLVLEFINAAGGLVAKGGRLAGFAIAGEDGRYVWADGRIDGNRVILSNPEIPCPSKVRYAWDDDPEVSLFNGEGLPASPFKVEVGK